FLSNRFDATQGRSSGMQINAVTKSGSNTPSGSFAGYFRNDRFNAADFVAKRVLPYSDQQLSGTFGGPIKKDRIHFFGNYEYERQPNTLITNNPYPVFNIGEVSSITRQNYFGGRLDWVLTPKTRLMARGSGFTFTVP